MDSTQKPFSDIEKTKKRYRAEHSDQYSGREVCRAVIQLFAQNNKTLEALAESWGNYWFESRIMTSANADNEPSTESLDVLAAMQNLLSLKDEETDCLTGEDWSNLCEETNFAAEDLPLEALNSLMSIFLDHKAL